MNIDEDCVDMAIVPRSASADGRAVDRPGAAAFSPGVLKRTRWTAVLEILRTPWRSAGLRTNLAGLMPLQPRTSDC
jgi:hypothetical protein